MFDGDSVQIGWRTARRRAAASSTRRGQPFAWSAGRRSACLTFRNPAAVAAHGAMIAGRGRRDRSGRCAVGIATQPAFDDCDRSARSQSPAGQAPVGPEAQGPACSAAPSNRRAGAPRHAPHQLRPARAVKLGGGRLALAAAAGRGRRSWPPRAVWDLSPGSSRSAPQAPQALVRETLSTASLRGLMADAQGGRGRGRGRRRRLRLPGPRRARHSRAAPSRSSRRPEQHPSPQPAARRPRSD